MAISLDEFSMISTSVCKSKRSEQLVGFVKLSKENTNNMIQLNSKVKRTHPRCILRTFQMRLARVLDVSRMCSVVSPSGEKGVWHSRMSCCSFIARFYACKDTSCTYECYLGAELYRRRVNNCICTCMYLKGITWLRLSSEDDFCENTVKFGTCILCQAMYIPLEMIGVNVESNVDFAHIHCRSCPHNHWEDLLSFLL